MGKLIVIEGLDGSGKATQTKLLANWCKNKNLEVREISFPDYESNSSALVKMYLNGEFGTSPSDVNAYAASAFYSVDRFASWKKAGSWGEFLNNGGIVLADRYTTSNIVHQCCKLPKAQREAFLAWVDDFEYIKLGIPSPELVIYLDVEPDVTNKLLTKRYNGETGKDIHEKNREYQAHCHEVALWCANKLGWEKIRCSENGKMRDSQDIAQEIAMKFARKFNLQLSEPL